MRTTSYVHGDNAEIKIEGSMQAGGTYVLRVSDTQSSSQFVLFLERHQVEDMILACDEALTAGGDKPLDLRPEAS